MNVASKELCQELYELSGWHWVEQYYEYYPVSGSTRLRSGYPGNVLPKMLPDFITPAYDLGFLLRKLPETAPVYDDIGSLELYKASGSWGIWYCVVDDYGNYDTEANTPEDAAAKLAIELFKQGILTRSEK